MTSGTGSRLYEAIGGEEAFRRLVSRFYQLVAADPVMADQNTVAGALAKAGCGAAENWIFADPFTERLTYEVDPNWGGELPYTLLVGTDASVTAILGEVNFSELRVWSARQGKFATGGP